MAAELENSSSSSSNFEEILEENQVELKKSRSIKHPSQREQKKTRKRKSDKDEWQKIKVKRLRNQGLSYESTKKIKNPDGTIEQTRVKRDGKQLLPPCGEKCRLKCPTKFTEENRQKIFVEYWEMGNLQRQRDFIISCMEIVKPKYRYEKAESCRRFNNAFYLNLEGQKVRICKQFFMATLGINSRMVRTVIEKQEKLTKGIIDPERRGKHGNHTSDGETVKMTDIKVLMVKKENPKIFHYKTTYEQKEFLSINIVNARRQEMDLGTIKLNNAYKQRPGITEAKKKGILSLIDKKIVPRYYFDFYKNL